MLIVHLFVSYAYVGLCRFFSSSRCQGLAATSALALPGLFSLPFGIALQLRPTTKINQLYIIAAILS